MYIIVNKKKINVINADTFIKRLIGLMGKTNINYGMYFKKCNSIHTFFMKENIDIIGLNNNQKIIFKNVNVPKNKMIFINNQIKNTNVLELPKNTSISLNIGDCLILYK